ncbi:hypothetical protein CS378_22940 [Rhodococcus ruber]|uniref:DUF2971 domain-containing protein n=2 Tax=Rhodococcus TaxID=1827 RepID=UPI000C160ECF|nr:DUF2971 domain-containing protein [Rhodococcus ruber]ATQ31315.1 hypothetical protein CS378_22940 [Rhodococcus ruber]
MKKAYFVPDNGEVHHYTDTGGLIGIIQGEKLWATNIQFLNDSLEYDFGLRAVIDALRDSLARAKESDSPTILYSIELENAVQAGITMLESTGPSPKDGQYVCCFSRCFDDLGQWRGYATDGYCITFDEHKLTKSLSESQPDERSVRHGSVAYGGFFEWGQAEYTDSVLSRLHEILHKSDTNLEEYGFSASDPIFGEFVRQNNRHALAAIAEVAAVQNSIPFLKEAGFADEQEMRVCVSHPNAVEFRPSKIGPIPYTELKFDPTCIKAITVGPGLNIELRQATLEYLLTQKFGKGHGIQVQKTELSFRG